MKHLIIAILVLTGLSPSLHAQGEVAGVMYSPDHGTMRPLVLPLERTEVVIDVTAGIARTEVAQRFHNTGKSALEAVYIFPLPTEAAVEDIEIRLADRVIRSTVQEREQAKATYEMAKAAGKTTALLEQERPNIFTTSVANILPGESVEIWFSYVEALTFRKDRYDITFPMVVGTRYIPFEFDDQGRVQPMVADAARLNPPVLHPNMDPGHRLSVLVHLAGLPIEELSSHTHAIEVETPGSDVYRVTLARGDVRADSEFNLVARLRPSVQPTASFVQTTEDGGTYGLLNVFPPLGFKSSMVAQPRDVVFLIDTSGSMSGESMTQARTGLQRCLAQLRPDDRFTIVRFSSDYSSFSPALRTATPEKLALAHDYAAGLQADGGTEMQPALKYALSMLSDSDRMPLILFLTDGDVGNEASLIRLLGRELDRARLFTFGIGSAPNAFLMHRMAEAGRGQSRFIRSHEDIGEVLTDLFVTLDSPVLTDVEIQWDDPIVTFFPRRCPDIFHDRPLQLVAHAPNGFRGHVKLSGRLNGEAVAYDIKLDDQEPGQHEAVGRLYGRRQIKDLMVDLMQTDRDRDRKELEQTITRVALDHQLVSAYTSRVAVEDRVVIRDGELVTVTVPVVSPKGWKLHATATTDPLQLLLGIMMLISVVLARRVGREA